jgi:formiminoglutamate deiminase
MSAFWCELAWLGGEQPEEQVLLEVSGGVIAGVRACVPAPPPGAQILRGLVVPGFANAHSHAFQRLMRGRTQRGEGSFWTWREEMYALAEALDLERFRRVTRAAYEEMALAGITLVGEFHYLHAGGNDFGEACVAAAAEVGIRITLLDACYLHGGLERFRDASAEAWARRVEGLALDGHRARLGAAIHSVRAVDPESAAVVATWARERGVPLHAHVSEQPAENEACLSGTGLTPTAVLARVRALDERFTAVHFTHVSEEDLATLEAAGGRVCMCPTTERDLADGVGPARAMVRAGIGLCLGSDSHAVIEPLEEARAVELDERLVSGVRGGLDAATLLRAATRGGYASLGWPEGGALAAGAPADFVCLRTGGVRLDGVPRQFLIDALIFAGAAADVGDVVVGGRYVVRDGELT